MPPPAASAAARTHRARAATSSWKTSSSCSNRWVMPRASTSNGCWRCARSSRRACRASSSMGRCGVRACRGISPMHEVSMALGEDFAEIRESVRAICEGFPGSYWRELEERHAYPEAFVKALTEAGYLVALIPEEYGGSGLPVRAAAVILEE